MVKKFPGIPGSDFYWCGITTLTNQVLSCGEIEPNQLREAYTARLIPSEVTSKISVSISVVNMIGLGGEKKKIKFPGIPGKCR